MFCKQYTARIQQLEAESDAATSQRSSEKADFLATERDYEESIEALQRAQGILRSQVPDKVAAHAALIQVSKISNMSKNERSIIDALVQQNPQGYAYESHSDGISEMLQNLENKFIEELRALQRDEANLKHNFQLTVSILIVLERLL